MKFLLIAALICFQAAAPAKAQNENASPQAKAKAKGGDVDVNFPLSTLPPPAVEAFRDCPPPGNPQGLNCPSKRRRLAQWNPRCHSSMNVLDELVSCWSQDAVMAKEDIPSTCDNEMYDVSLYTLEGVHFFLLGKKQDADNTNCPSNQTLQWINRELEGIR